MAQVDVVAAGSRRFTVDAPAVDDEDVPWLAPGAEPDGIVPEWPESAKAVPASPRTATTTAATPATDFGRVVMRVSLSAPVVSECSTDGSA